METSISRTSAQSLKCQCKIVAKLRQCIFLVPKRFPQPKILCHAKNPNFQLSLGFYLDTDQILKVWSPLDKRIYLHKFWPQKGSQCQKSTMPCPKSKFSTFIRFLPTILDINYLHFYNFNGISHHKRS